MSSSFFELENDVLEIRYRKFPNYLLSFPIDWFANPYGSTNWTHNFLSLRWINNCNLKVREKVIGDFLVALQNKPELRNYIQGRRRDHTSAIRLTVLASFHQADIKHSYRNDLNNELRRQLDELLYSETYKIGHNHALMIDESILTVSRILPGFLVQADLNLVISRINRQLDSLFDEDGFTREHSISYQEFTAAIACRISKIIEHNVLDSAEVNAFLERITVIKNATKSLLAFSLRKNGEYIPFGDSFNKASKSSLNDIFDSSEPKTIFAELYNKNG